MICCSVVLKSFFGLEAFVYIHSYVNHSYACSNNLPDELSHCKQFNNIEIDWVYLIVEYNTLICCL